MTTLLTVLTPGFADWETALLNAGAGLRVELSPTPSLRLDRFAPAACALGESAPLRFGFDAKSRIARRHA